MKYVAKLKSLDVKLRSQLFEIQAQLEWDFADPLGVWASGDENPNEMVGPSAIRVETTLRTLPATTESQWTAWAVRYLADRLPDTEAT